MSSKEDKDKDPVEIDMVPATPASPNIMDSQEQGQEPHPFCFKFKRIERKVFDSHILEFETTNISELHNDTTEGRVEELKSLIISEGTEQELRCKLRLKTSSDGVVPSFLLSSVKEQKEPVTLNIRVYLKLDKVMIADSGDKREKFQGTAMEFCPKLTLLRSYTEVSDHPMKITFSVNANANPPSENVPSTKKLTIYSTIETSFLDFSLVGEHTDLAIKGGNETREVSPLHLHSKIIAEKCPALITYIESQKPRLKPLLMPDPLIADVSNSSLKIFLSYIYNGKILNEWKEKPDQLLLLAYQFEMSDLFLYLQGKIMEVANMENCVSLFKVSKKCKLSDLAREIWLQWCTVRTDFWEHVN